MLLRRWAPALHINGQLLCTAKLRPCRSPCSPAGGPSALTPCPLPCKAEAPSPAPQVLLSCHAPYMSALPLELLRGGAQPAARDAAAATCCVHFQHLPLQLCCKQVAPTHDPSLTLHVTLQEAAASAGPGHWPQAPPAVLSPVRAAPSRPPPAGGSAVRRSISDIPPARLEPHHIEGRASDLSCRPALADRIQQLERQARRWAPLLQVLCGIG